jgi:hypothetical protein
VRENGDNLKSFWSAARHLRAFTIELSEGPPHKTREGSGAQVRRLKWICNNQFESMQMKRLLLTGLALLLMLSSLGHVLAAAFCPRALGRQCCFAKAANPLHKPSSSYVNNAVADMHMDGMRMDGMNMGDTSMDHNAMDNMVSDATTSDVSIPSRLAYGEEVVANRFNQPVESCAHCLGHSGVVNAPVSSVSVSDQSAKDIGPVLLPVSRFLNPPATALAQIGLPREHAPPGSGAPRPVLIGVFLI